MDADLKRVGARIRDLRVEQKLAQDELADRADLHRTYVGGVERGERNLGVLNLIAIARALGVEPAALLSGFPITSEPTVPRHANAEYLLTDPKFYAFGLDSQIVAEAVHYVHRTFDDIDSKLTEGGGERLGGLVELANLSAIIGNLFRNGVVRAGAGKFKANGPHKYPDLLGIGNGCEDVEIKVALEHNKPKGHLIKPGPHILVRYVLIGEDGAFSKGKENRGLVVKIWEVRIGRLTKAHFNESNTEGDSGKTAVINAAGMTACHVVYCDLTAAAIGEKSLALFRSNLPSSGKK